MSCCRLWLDLASIREAAELSDGARGVQVCPQTQQSLVFGLAQMVARLLHNFVFFIAPISTPSASLTPATEGGSSIG